MEAFITGESENVQQLHPVYHEIYRGAWEWLEQLLWATDEAQEAIPRQMIRDINANIYADNELNARRRNTGLIDAELYSKIGEMILRAAAKDVREGDNSEYQHLRDRVNEYFNRANYPAIFEISDVEYNALFEALGTAQADLDQNPPEQHGGDDHREELENAYTQNENENAEQMHEPEEPNPAPAEEYDANGFFHQESPLPPSPNGEPEPQPTNRSHWEATYVDIDELRNDTQRVWGSLMTEGEILAYRLHGRAGYSVIVGYSCNGNQIARVEAAARRPIPESATLISEKSKARKSVYEDRRSKYKEYRNRGDIKGLGLIAWRVDGKYDADPTSILRPSIKAWYPETYIQVYWTDETWSWESRDGFRFVFGGDPYRVDILIYRQAISLDGDYQEALTGSRPEFPDGTAMSNRHWRNENAFGGAYWLQPRAREAKRVTKVEEEDIRDIKAEDEDRFSPQLQNAYEPYSGNEFRNNPDAPGNWEPSAPDRETQGYGDPHFESFERPRGALSNFLRTGNLPHSGYSRRTQDRQTPQRNREQHRDTNNLRRNTSPRTPLERQTPNIANQSRNGGASDTPRAPQRNPNAPMQSLGSRMSHGVGTPQRNRSVPETPGLRMAGAQNSDTSNMQRNPSAPVGNQRSRLADEVLTPQRNRSVPGASGLRVPGARNGDAPNVSRLPQSNNLPRTWRSNATAAPLSSPSPNVSAPPRGTAAATQRSRVNTSAPTISRNPGAAYRSEPPANTRSGQRIDIGRQTSLGTSTGNRRPTLRSARSQIQSNIASNLGAPHPSSRPAGSSSGVRQRFREV